MSQVISKIAFNDAKINDGEWPTPSVLNRPLLAAMDADTRLEETVKFTSRGVSLIPTTNTTFLTHFRTDKFGCIGNTTPVGTLISQPHADFTSVAQCSSPFKYKDAVSTNGGVGSLIYWVKLVTQSAMHSPMYIASGDSTLSISAVHTSTATDATLKIRVTRAGTTTYGTTINLPLSCIGAYVPCVIRYNIDASGATFEVSIIDPALEIHKSTLLLPTFTLPNLLDIAVGSDGTMASTAGTTVAEVRYDKEWINDYELEAVALSNRSFGLDRYNYDRLDHRIDVETAERIAADNHLQAEIDNEIVDRIAGDAAEATARANTDSNLQAQIDGLKSTVSHLSDAGLPTTPSTPTPPTTPTNTASGSSVAVVSGTLKHGDTIPLPTGYTQEQCNWMVSMNYGYLADCVGIHSGQLICKTNGRVIECYAIRWTDGAQYNPNGGTEKLQYEYGWANYIIVGVK